MNNPAVIKLLYVDDDEMNLIVFKMNFETKYTVYTASSGWEAIEVLNQHHDDIIVVISDMKMPRMDGVDFIKSAKRKYRNIIYFILSGFGYNEKIAKAIEAKIVDQFFTKPFDMNQIEKVIYDKLDTRFGI